MITLVYSKRVGVCNNLLHSVYLTPSPRLLDPPAALADANLIVTTLLLFGEFF